MATAHNLTVISNNLSGYDGAAGQVDGTTVGKSYVTWKLFQALLAFDSNLKMITSSSPTPAFLQAEVGTLIAEPLVSRSNSADTIRFYFANDAGLSATTPSAVIYTWTVASGNNVLVMVTVSHKITGGSIWTPASQTITGSALTNNFFFSSTWTITTTVMNNIPRFIFWKSDNATMIMSIQKSDGAYLGVLTIFNPSFTGYRTTISAITDGTNFRMPVFLTGNSISTTSSAQISIIEPFTTYYITGGSNSQPATFSTLCSVGTLPTALLTINGVSTLVCGSLKFGFCAPTTIKAISSYIDGVVLAHVTAVSGAIGLITPYNSVYYILGCQITDGRDFHRILYHLGT